MALGENEAEDIRATVERKQKEREAKLKEKEAAQVAAINEKIRLTNERKAAAKAQREVEAEERIKKETEIINAKLREKR